MPVQFTGNTVKIKIPNRGRGKNRIRRRMRTRKGILRNALKPKTYAFKRDIEAVYLLSNTTPPEGWTVSGTSLGINLGWSMGSLGAVSLAEFQQLFNQYKLAGARVKMFFSNTESGTDGAQEFSNSQLIVRMAQNQDGVNDTLDNQYWRETQAKKYKTAINGGKPLDIYMPLMIPNTVEAAAGSGRTMTKPKYLPVQDSGVVHYGLNISIERASGQAFSTGHANNQYVRFITTLYFKCRGVS